MRAMKIWQVLVAALLAASIALSGCNGGSKWNREDIKAKLKAQWSEQVAQKGGKAHCTDITLVATDDPNMFDGAAMFDDGSSMNFTVKIDPETGDFIANHK